jgi:hypothetical protein
MFSQRETGGRGSDMDSEATVILRRPGLGSPRKASRTSRTESTAVFVGRASFQMIPAHTTVLGDESTGAEVQRPHRTAADEARREIVEALRAEARALRAESEARVAAAAAAVTTLTATPAPGPTLFTRDDVIEVDEVPSVEAAPERRGVVLQLLPQVDVTEPINARARASGRTRRGMSGRTIVLALIAGASITLSAQAVIRRPDAVRTVATSSSAPATEPAAAPTAANTDVTPPVAVAAPPFVPTVVASTATAAQTEEPAPAPALPSRKRVRARAVATAHPAHAKVAKVAAKSKSAWVDPFAGPTAAKPSATTWIDPFAN